MRSRDTDDSISVIYYPSESERWKSHHLYLALPTPVNEGRGSSNSTVGGGSTQMEM